MSIKQNVFGLGREDINRSDIFADFQQKLTSNETGLLLTPGEADLRVLSAPAKLLIENSDLLLLDSLSKQTYPDERPIDLQNIRVTDPKNTSGEAVRLQVVADIPIEIKKSIVNETDKIRRAAELPELSQRARRNLGRVPLFTIQGDYTLWEPTVLGGVEKSIVDLTKEVTEEQIILGKVSQLR